MYSGGWTNAFDYAPWTQADRFSRDGADQCLSGMRSPSKHKVYTELVGSVSRNLQGNRQYLLYCTYSRLKNRVHRNHLGIWLNSFQKDRNSLIGFCQPRQLVLPLYRCNRLFVESRPNLELADGNCESRTQVVTKHSGTRAMTRAGGLIYTIKLKSACREPDLSLSEPHGLGPSSSIENRNSLACLPG